MIRVLIVDDQAIIRDGLAMIVGAADDMEVVATAADGVEAVALARSLRPDVVLMDLRMPRLDGVQATGVVRRELPSTQVLVLTTYDADTDVIQALRSGAAGYLLKDTGRHALLAGIRAAAHGDVTLSPAVVQAVLGAARSPVAPSALASAVGRLTDRERAVLIAVGDGLNNAEISSRLSISEGTVKTHLARVLAKVGARDRTQLAVIVNRYEWPWTRRP